jgi:hypothetical protein
MDDYELEGHPHWFNATTALVAQNAFQTVPPDLAA